MIYFIGTGDDHKSRKKKKETKHNVVVFFSSLVLELNNQHLGRGRDFLVEEKKGVPSSNIHRWGLWPDIEDRKVLSLTVPSLSLIGIRQHFSAGDNKIDRYRPHRVVSLLLQANLSLGEKMGVLIFIEAMGRPGTGLKTADVTHRETMTIVCRTPIGVTANVVTMKKLLWGVRSLI